MEKMLMKLEEARVESIGLGTPIYAMSNGEEIEIAYAKEVADKMKENGFWVCSIFQHGHRAEA